ncbi:hypothetical protein [Streptomyces sp. NPDC005209]|uniref:hypothetical protein n=1 Tax=Streptomyces sp. NPDC005209 TaxID=3156715 RepID=UPI0033A34434
MELLPLNGTTLASDPRVLEAARTAGARHGIDYTDDAAVTALLTERRRAMESAQRGPLIWVGGLTLTAGAVLPFLSSALPGHAAKAALLVSGPLLVIAIAALVQVRVRWKRELTHPALVGYRELLGRARAHGLPLAYVPGWLEGRASGGAGKPTAPIPTYEPVQPYGGERPPLESPSPGAPEPRDAAHPPIPAKSPAVASFELLGDEGGDWHDEAGCLLFLAGGGGALWAATSDAPIGYAALVLVPIALLIWLSGMRRAGEKERLRQEALSYVRAIAQAQAAGAEVPELSPALRKLLDERPLS